MSDAGTIIVIGSGPIHRELEEALASARAAGVAVVFREDPPPPDRGAVLQAMPPIPEINLTALKRTHVERATQNQPWYAKFQKKRRRK